MRFASKFLLVFAWIIGLAIAALLAMMAAGIEAAVWMGGFGLLFLGIPLFVLWLMCVLVGLSLRTKTMTDQRQVQTDKKQPRKLLEWTAVAAGVLLLIYLAFEVVLASLYGVPVAYGALSGMGLSVPSNNGLLVALALFDIKLPLALGAIAFGATRLLKQGKPDLVEQS